MPSTKDKPLTIEQFLKDRPEWVKVWIWMMLDFDKQEDKQCQINQQPQTR